MPFKLPRSICQRTNISLPSESCFVRRNRQFIICSFIQAMKPAFATPVRGVGANDFNQCNAIYSTKIESWLKSVWFYRMRVKVRATFMQSLSLSKCEKNWEFLSGKNNWDAPLSSIFAKCPVDCLLHGVKARGWVFEKEDVSAWKIHNVRHFKCTFSWTFQATWSKCVIKKGSCDLALHYLESRTQQLSSEQTDKWLLRFNTFINFCTN